MAKLRSSQSWKSVPVKAQWVPCAPMKRQVKVFGGRAHARSRSTARCARVWDGGDAFPCFTFLLRGV